MNQCGTIAPIRRVGAVLAIVAGLLSSGAMPARAAGLPPAPKHIVVVFEENEDLDDIVSNDRLGWLHAVIARGALFTDSHGRGTSVAAELLRDFPRQGEHGRRRLTCPQPGTPRLLRTRRIARRFLL